MSENGTLASNRAAMDAFLERMRQSGNVYLSCRAAGVPRSTAYRWRNKWQTFADEWDDAKDDAVDRLDAEAWRRAVEEKSDRLIMFLLKAHKPSVYSPVVRSETEISGKGGGAIEINDKQSEYHNRAVDTLATTLGSLLAERRDGEPGAMDAAE